MTEQFQTIQEIVNAAMNNWGGIHPAVVHFPVGLLFIAPIFIVLGMVYPKSSKAFNIAALCSLLIGTAFIFLAYSTGEAAAEVLKPNKSFLATLNAHDESAHQTKRIFSILSILFFIYVTQYTKIAKKLKDQTHTVVLVLYLVSYLYGILIVTHTAHLGGKLVHDHGIQSDLYQKSK